MKKIGKYSFGLGDRFAHQGEAQLRAIQLAKEAGVEIIPVWNKSHREHQTLNTTPAQLRQEADAAVKALGWQGNYLVDADHITMDNVDGFINTADFFTIDVADFIGKAPAPEEIEKFVAENKSFIGALQIPGINHSFAIDEEFLRKIARNFLLACREASNIYQYIAQKKGAGNFVTEVSMDEVENPQSPAELFFILKLLASFSVPLQTIAPKFTGNFFKGVDYQGTIGQFEKEFEEDILLIRYAIQEFGLPETLKLSIHSGSDKFSLYGPIQKIIYRHNAGIHIKTAGTTWLEELIGLAEAEGKSLELAKEIYREALNRFDELTAPYEPVLDIHKDQLPSVEEVKSWSGKEFAEALRHQQEKKAYNPSFRQLLHCAYKIAGEKGKTYTDALKKDAALTGKNVTDNLWKRHIKPLFIKS